MRGETPSPDPPPNPPSGGSTAGPPVYEILGTDTERSNLPEDPVEGGTPPLPPLGLVGELRSPPPRGPIHPPRFPSSPPSGSGGVTGMASYRRLWFLGLAVPSSIPGGPFWPSPAPGRPPLGVHGEGGPVESRMNRREIARELQPSWDQMGVCRHLSYCMAVLVRVEGMDLIIPQRAQSLRWSPPPMANDPAGCFKLFRIWERI